MVGQIVHIYVQLRQSKRKYMLKIWYIASLNIDTKTKQKTIYCIIRTKTIPNSYYTKSNTIAIIVEDINYYTNTIACML